MEVFCSWYSYRVSLAICMGSHSVTCHPTQVNTPRLNPSHAGGTRFTYPGGMEGWVDLVDLIAPLPGVEPATFRSRIQRWTNATTKTTRMNSCFVSLFCFSSGLRCQRKQLQISPAAARGTASTSPEKCVTVWELAREHYIVPLFIHCITVQMYAVVVSLWGSWGPVPSLSGNGVEMCTFRCRAAIHGL